MADSVFFQLFRPVRGKRGVGGAGYRVFINAGLRGKKPGNKIAVIASDGYN